MSVTVDEMISEPRNRSEENMQMKYGKSKVWKMWNFFIRAEKIFEGMKAVNFP